MHTNPKGLIAVVFGTKSCAQNYAETVQFEEPNLNILNKICTYDPIIYSNIACFYVVGVGKTIWICPHERIKNIYRLVKAHQ